MKKFYSIVLAALAVCAVSCQEGPLDKPEAEAPQTGETMTFTASLPDTKVSIGDDEITPYWDDNDAITIYMQSDAYKNGKLFQTGKLEDRSSANFTSKEQLTGFDGPYFAVYGHQNTGVSNLFSNNDGNNISNVKIPSVQKLKDYFDGTYYPYCAPFVAYSTTRSLTFKPLAALLKFKVNAPGVTSVRLEADVPISGEGNVNVKVNGEDFTSDFTLYSGGSNTVELKGKFEENITYYVAVAPTTIHSLKMYVNDRIYRSVENVEIPISRGQIFDLKQIDGAIVYLKQSNWNNRRTNEIVLNAGSKSEEYIFEAAYSDNAFDNVNGSRWNIYKPGIVGSTMNIRFGTQWDQGKNSNTIEVTFKEKMYFYIDKPDNHNGWTPIPFDAHNVNF